MLGRSWDSTKLEEAGTAADRGRIGGVARACLFFVVVMEGTTHI